MLIIAGGRRTGKTYRLAQMMRNNPNAIMLEPNIAMIHYVEQEYPHLRGRVFSATNRTDLLGRGNDIYVDNVDQVLWDYLGRRPAVATLTGMVEDISVTPEYLKVSDGL